MAEVQLKLVSTKKGTFIASKSKWCSNSARLGLGPPLTKPDLRVFSLRLVGLASLSVGVVLMQDLTLADLGFI